MTNNNPVSPWSCEGRVLSSALHAAGIPAEQVDYHIHFCYPHLEYGFNRYRIFIPPSCQEAAREVISNASQRTFEPIHACPKCNGSTRKVRRWAVTLILYGFFGVFWPFFKKSRRCWTCKWTWEPAPPEPWTKEELGYDPYLSLDNQKSPNIGKINFTKLIKTLKNSGHKARETDYKN